MLTPLCYKILANRKLPEPHRRVMMAVLCEYDLRNFIWVDAVDLFFRYEFDRLEQVQVALAYFENVGILEAGPRVIAHQTYRIRPAYLISDPEIKRIEAERQRRAEREKITPMFGVPRH